MISEAPHLFAKEAAASVAESAYADPSTATSIFSRFIEILTSH
jgi:hypothetical protein